MAMIDDGPKGSWTREKDMDLRTMPSHKLQQDETAIAVRNWYALATIGEAKAMIGQELNRRTRQTLPDVY
jgi:hypothetical protein